MPISFRRMTRDSESSRPRPPFVSRPSGRNLLGTRAARPSGGTGGGKQNFQKAKGSFLPNNPSRPAVRIGKAGSGVVNSNALRPQGGSWSGSKNTDFLTRQLNRHADATLKNLPSLRTGLNKSLDLTLNYEGSLYFNYLDAGGSNNTYFAKNNQGNSEGQDKNQERYRQQMIDRDSRQTRNELINVLQTIGYPFPVISTLSNSDLYNIAINWSSDRVETHAKAIIGNLDIKVDYSKLRDLSLTDLQKMLSILNAKTSPDLKDKVTNYMYPPFISMDTPFSSIPEASDKDIERPKDVIDGMFILSVLRETDAMSEIPTSRGIKDFKDFSNIVANLTTNDTSDYLYVMNTLFLSYSSSGDLATAYTAERIKQNQLKGTSIVESLLAEEQINYLRNTRVLDNISLGVTGQNVIKIGDEGLNNDYSDKTSEQISRHIWAYFSTAVSSGEDIAVLATTIHDQIIVDPTDTTKEADYRAGRVAAYLGGLLRNGVITPKDIGKEFEKLFSMDFDTFWDIYKE